VHAFSYLPINCKPAWHATIVSLNYLLSANERFFSDHFSLHAQ
jgi:hypothetical protein